MEVLFMALAGILTISPFPILAIFYESVPNQVPLFVDLTGNPTVMTTKNIFSVFRLPLMGLMIQLLSISMCSIKFEDVQKTKINKTIWLAISMIGAIKMSLTSLEILIYENLELLSMIRTFVLVVIALGIIVLLANLFILYRKLQNGFLRQYYRAVGNPRLFIIISSLAVYILLVVLPAAL